MNRRNFLKRSAAGAATGLAVAGGMAGYLPSAYAQPAQPAAGSPEANQKFSLVGFDDNENRIIRLENFAGKVCLISFFTSGCNLCNRDLKQMREFYVRNKKKDFMLLGVNMDESKTDFEDYKRLINLSVPKEQNFPVLWRKGQEHVDTFGTIKQKPTHFVLDKSHKLLFRREGSFLPDDWDTLWTKIS